jgi:phage replication O-like protein O
MTKNHLIESPNFTQIPNVIFDYWLQVLTPAEFKVLLCICRKTFGWHKIKDKISLTQIEKLTGLCRSSIVKNVEKLIEYDLVIKHKSKDEFDGSDAPNQYEIHVVNIENIGGSKPNALPLVHSVHPPLVHSVHTQKKALTKETFTKETTTTSLGGDDDVVDKSISLDANLAIKSMKEFLDKRANLEDWGLGWVIPVSTYIYLVKEYGPAFVNDQVMHLTAIHSQAIKDELIPYKKKKTRRIDKPETVLKLACKDNYALSLNDKKETS